MFEIAGELVAVLILAAFAAGFVDAIAGGGGLITVPVLLLCGLSPAQALATNKLQGTFGAGTAALAYARAGLVDLRAQGRLAALAALAAGAGALLAQVLPPDLLRLVMPWLLIGAALYFGLKPGLTDLGRPRRLAPLAFAVLVVPALGFYDGFFGPGTGSLFMIAFVLLAGQGMLAATAQTKLLNFASNLGGLVVFAAGGQVLWTLGLAMAAAQVAGASLGARVAMRRGAGVIRPLLVLVCLGMAIRLLWQAGG